VVVLYSPRLTQDGSLLYVVLDAGVEQARSPYGLLTGTAVRDAHVREPRAVGRWAAQPSLVPLVQYGSCQASPNETGSISPSRPNPGRTVGRWDLIAGHYYPGHSDRQSGEGYRSPTRAGPRVRSTPIARLAVVAPDFDTRLYVLVL
jgi:hypothetical protein